MSSTVLDLAEATPADRMVLAGIAEAIRHVRSRGEQTPAAVVVAQCLAELGISLPKLASAVDLRAARGEWLRRLESSRRSASTINAYRVALDDLLDWLTVNNRLADAFREDALVAYLDSYREARSPAPATYYRRFTLLRRFYRWMAAREGLTDPFADLDGPPKPRQEADWLTHDEFARLVAAASTPPRRVPGLAERDRLVLVALVTTGLRRAELVALNWGDLVLSDDKPSVLVRSGKGGKPRRQPLAASVAIQLRRLRGDQPATAPVFTGLCGGRLQPTVLANIIRRSALRAGLEKTCTAHTLRHTAATWLRQTTGDARLVAEYLGHADLSTVSRYAHVANDELHEAAQAIAAAARI